MSSTMAPNVRDVDAPGRRTAYSMCGMCAVRCPIEVTVDDGKVTWVQGNPHDLAIGASLCAKGSAGLALEYADDQRPQTPLIRTGARGAGQWRRASWDDALDYIADKLRETIATFGGRGIALSDRGGPFTELTRTFLQALGSPNYFNHDITCAGNGHNSAMATLGFSHFGLIPDFHNIRHLVLYGRNIIESLMVKEAKAFMAGMANGMRVTYIDPRATATACKAHRYWQVRPNSDYALNLALIHELLAQEAYDKDFVARHVSGMDTLREAVERTTPEWQQPHTGVAADQLRAFVAEIAADRPRVVFHPGWHAARHKQSFHVSRTTLDSQCADGQHRSARRPGAGEGPRAGRPQEPEAPDHARAAGARAACRRRGHRPSELGCGHRRAASECSRLSRAASPTALAPTSPTATIR